MNLHFRSTIIPPILATLTVGIFMSATHAQAQLSSHQEYGIGTGQQAGAHGWGVFLMIGLIIGLIAGILLTFYGLARRERQTIGENREFEALMEALEEAESDLQPQTMNPFSGNTHQQPRPNSDYTEPVDPWERPNVWRKKSDDDR